MMNIMSYLKKGAFLTTACDGKVNTMTISWGNIGVEWGEDIFTVLVRDSRYTKSFLDKNGLFTVTVPKDNSFKSELAFCGSKSGRDFDKIKECGLTLESSEMIEVPHITGNAFIFECRVMYSQRMDENSLSPELREKFYPTKDMHTMYHGKILKMYER